MTLNIRINAPSNRMKPRITVIGVGGAGGNAVNNMINSQLEGCEFLVCNTDAQSLEGNASTHKIQLGAHVTRGLGAGANPEIGRAAAEESIEEILSLLDGSNMVFVTAGMGGGTGTGAAPVIAQAARQAGILTVGVVTKPFHFEGTHRMKLAEAGITELQKHVDTLIIIPNQNLFRIANEKTTFSDAFRMADEVLQSGVRGVTDLMVMPGLINLDFADIRAVMAEMGKAMMGTGEAEGDRRAIDAAEKAISNPLLDDVSMKGARGVLINITGGLDMTLFEVDEAANRIRDEVDPDANIIFGSTFDQSMQGKMRVSVVATGIEAANMAQTRPLHLATAAVDPARRPVGLGGARPTVNTNANYGQTPSAYAAAPQMVATRATQGFNQPMMQQQVQQPVMQAQMQQPMASAPVEAPVAMEPVAQPQMGQATPAVAPQSFAATATAAKMDDAQWNQVPATPPVTQSYNRPVPSAASAQPRAQRHGDAFIPPRPVDPKAVAAPAAAQPAADLFAAPMAPQWVEASEAELAPRAPVVEKEAKKSAGLLDRLGLGRRHEEVEAPVVKETQTGTKLSVETGGKQDEDELDIPAFLRRQAN